MSRLRTRLALAVVAIAAVVVVPAASAGGDPPTGVGWWTSENAGLPTGLIPTLLPPSGGPVSAAPSDIPQGGFEVTKAGGVESYAALSYDAYSGVTPSKVVLAVHQPAANIPGSKLLACPLDGDGTFGDARGDPLSAGPTYDCDKGVPGIEDASAGTMSFEVGSLVRGSRLAVAIVGGEGSRVVFDPPGAGTVVVAGGDTGPASDLAIPLTDSSIVDGTAPDFTVPDEPFAATPDVAPPPAPPSSPHRPAPAATAAERTELAAVTRPAASTGAGSAIVGALAVLLGAAAVTMRNRRARS